MRFPLALAIGLLSATGAALAAPQGPLRAVVQVVASAEVGERTALAVSTRVLRFDVPPGASSATASVEFTAGVRTHPDRHVLVVGRAEGPSGLELRYAGEGAGFERGALAQGEPAILARWSGGGRRHGRITFTLEQAGPGTYTVPIQLTISVP